MPVGGYYNVAVFGDSVMWGQGLRGSEKIHTRVIEGLTNRLAGTTVRLKGNFAHSGATIGLLADGRREVGQPPGVTRGTPQEVNVSFPTILDQIDQFQGDASAIDLILLNGGMNDVNVRTMLPSLNDSELTRLIKLHCHDHMKSLLLSALRKFPNAQIVVSGYYPIISESSFEDYIRPFLVALGLWDIMNALIAGADILKMRNRLAANCALFNTVSDSAFVKAVDEVNRERAAQPGASRRVHFVTPQFDRDDAACTISSMLFGIDRTSNPLDPPEVRDQRILACGEAYNNDPTGRQVCNRASVGHPNPRGAQRYADEILAVLDGAGVTGVSQAFPKDFLWGAATAGYQVEGGITNNDWHVFTTDRNINTTVNLRGRLGGFDIHLSPAGDAITHDDRATLVDDLDRMVALGMNAYRFSIEWSRIEPRMPQNGQDFNNAALDYYDFVVDEVMKRGMEPIVTLNHLTLPEWVLHPPANSLLPVFDGPFQRSLRGWENSATVDAFVAFVGRMAAHFRSRVKIWITLNEPVASMIGIGYIAGLWSPGLSDSSRARAAYFNLLRAHGRSYDLIKDADPRARVGIAHAMMFAKPVDVRDVSLLLGDCPDGALRQFNYFFNWHFIDSLMRPDVNLTLDEGHREIRRLRDTFQRQLDRAQAEWDANHQRIAQLLLDWQNAVRDFKNWLKGSARRNAIFNAWRTEFGNLAATNARALARSFGAPAAQQTDAANLARTAVHRAVDLLEGAIKEIIAGFLAPIADGVAGIIEGAANLNEAERQIGDHIFRLIRRGVDEALKDLGLPADVAIPNEQVLAAAAQQAIEGLSDFSDLLSQAVDVLRGRRSAESLLPELQETLSKWQSAWNTLMKGTQKSEDFFGAEFRPRLDFLGINYYRAASIHVGPMFEPVKLMGAGFVGAIFTQNYENSLDKHHTLLNDLSWQVYPSGLYQLMKTVDSTYDHLPVLITENGMAEELDRNRAAYTVAHLEALHRAHREGVTVLGYLHWSICDNFEWFENYNPKARFGLFTIDRAQTPHSRRITEAALALSLAIAENGIAGLADRFGSIHPLGYCVNSPLRSAVRSFRGSFNAGPLFQTNEKFALHLTSRTNGEILGLLFLNRDASWHRLAVTLTQQGAISFRLRDGFIPGLQESNVTATINGGTLSGTINESLTGRSQMLTAQLDPLAGNWIGNMTPRILQVLRPQLEPGLGRIKAFRANVGQPSWIATLDSNGSGSLENIACVFDDPDHPAVNDFTLTARFDSATGQLVGTSNQNKWSAVRLPDGLPAL